MDRFVEDFKEIVEERDYLQDVVYPKIMKKLQERGRETITAKKERNELREQLKNQQAGNTKHMDVLLDLMVRGKVNSRLKNICEEIKK